MVLPLQLVLFDSSMARKWRLQLPKCMFSFKPAFIPSPPGYVKTRGKPSHCPHFYKKKDPMWPSVVGMSLEEGTSTAALRFYHQTVT